MRSICLAKALDSVLQSVRIEMIYLSPVTRTFGTRKKTPWNGDSKVCIYLFPFVCHYILFSSVPKRTKGPFFFKFPQKTPHHRFPPKKPMVRKVPKPHWIDWDRDCKWSHDEEEEFRRSLPIRWESWDFFWDDLWSNTAGAFIQKETSGKKTWIKFPVLHGNGGFT